MQNRWLVLACTLGGAFVFAALWAAVSDPASAHEAACHTDHTCPSDVTPPDYVCGDNPATTCSAPNSPTTSQPNAAPQLGGPPTADDCRNYEIFYNGSICKQVLGVASASPTVSGSPSAPATPSSAPPTGTPAEVPGLTDPLEAIPSSGTGSFGTLGVLVWAFVLAASVFMVAAMWQIFRKAGEPGWAALVPIYNSIVYLKVAGRPWWWIFILWLIVPVFVANSDLARSFGRSSGFGIGLTLLPFVFFPILAFGNADYRPRDRGPRPLPL